MEKLLRPKDKILLGLFLLGDLYFYIAEPLSVQLGKIKGTLPPNYKASNLYNTVYRLLATQEIEKVIKNGQVYYRLTGIGSKKLKRDFPLVKLQQQKWDGLWRIVIFDIKEKDKKIRESLRYKLTSLGFGMWQKSVYVTPFNVAKDLKQYLITNGLEDLACVLIAKHLFVGNIKDLACRIWKLDLLNEQYKNLIDEWKINKSKLSNKELISKAKEYYSKYLDIVINDPFLPEELLPSYWVGNRAKKLIKEWNNYF